MNKDELLEEYRKIKLREELAKAMWKKYKPKKLYNIWSNLKHINKKEFSLRYNEWLSFEDFVKWSENNGYKEGLHLLRYDKSKPYTADNCVFSEFTSLNLSSNYLKYRGRYKKN